MARIGEAELERLKASVPVADLVAASGVVLARQGVDLAGLCPFHEDRIRPVSTAAVIRRLCVSRYLASANSMAAVHPAG